MRPVLLDLFCGAGGAATGYHRAGFDVVGVDIAPQPRYPFTFVRANALDILDSFPRAILDRDVAAVHASPPCQRYSSATKQHDPSRHPDLVGPVRARLIRTGLPYVIENVVGAPLIDPVLVCGTERRLGTATHRLRRHRLFELSFPHHPFPGCGCADDARPILDVTGGGPTRSPRTDGRGGRPFKGSAAECRWAMGMPWATKQECNEAIPPAYTELVGSHLIQVVS